MSFVYTRLTEELRERWRIETEAALVGWHFACVMAGDETPPPRPDIPDWMDVRRTFDTWLVSEPDGDAETADDDVSAERLDVMVAYGWKE